MSGVVREWIAKAEGDFSTARRELEVTERPNYDAVCFHSHQCVEKLMKALLIQNGAVPPKSHDLVELDRRLQGTRAAWRWPVEELRLLTRAAVEFRYPGESAELREARATFDTCERMREALLSRLQSSDSESTESS